jgi:hypothetical protein
VAGSFGQWKRQNCIVGDFSYSIDTENHLTIINISGTISYELAERMVRELAADPAFDAKNRTLIDAKRVAWESSLGELQEMAGLSEEVQSMFQGGNAIVLPDPLHRDLGELFVTYARMNGVDWSAFGDFDKARNFLLEERPKKASDDEADS